VHAVALLWAIVALVDANAQDVAGYEYLTDLTLVGCPNSGAEPDSPDDRDFVYLGHLVRNDADVQVFAENYRAWASAGGRIPAFGNDVPNSLDANSFRLREGVERFVITDINDPAASAKAQSTIPVLIDWPDRHLGGGHVLFMVGHVAFMKCPGEWPMAEATIGTLAELAGREPVRVMDN